MTTAAHFRVQPRLISLLGAQYHSIEEALKELVANAWDADATQVDIALPEPMTGDPIIVGDNGYGMTRREIEDAYLNIAYNRRVQSERTPKGREVRGYRGIGKFAGLIAAQRMAVTTESRGTRTRLVLDRAQLADDVDDIEQAEIALVEEASTGANGTTVILEGLGQRFQLPTRQSLGRVLLREFKRTNEFQVRVNGVQLAADVLVGERVEVALALPTGHAIPCQVWFVTKGGVVADPGIIIRVGERAIGAPTVFGLDRDPEVPKSLLKRVYGEIKADHLMDQVLASWGGFVQNSFEYQQLQVAGRAWLKREILQRRDAEVGGAPEAFVETYADDIERLPLPRREQAKRALNRVFKRFYDEVPERRDAIARLVLEALETDEYWALVKGIDEAKDGDVIRLAELLQHWGLNEIAALSYRARMRLRGIDAFEQLIRDPSTLELSGVHRALRENIWLLGDQYEVMTSNKTLRHVVESMLDRKYRGVNADLRPDLILAGARDRYLLVELKRPSHSVDHQDVAQALGYRGELLHYLPDGGFEIMVVGGSVSDGFRSDAYQQQAARVTTFWQVVREARERMTWLVEHLDIEDDWPAHLAASAPDTVNSDVGNIARL